MSQEPPAADITALGNLQTTLQAALHLIRDLAGDELLGRIIAAFHAMPADDRPVVIGVLEREVKGRLLSRGTEGPVGQSTRPNPNARLYIRSLDSGFDRRMLEREEMMIANVRAMRVAGIIRNVPEIYDAWKAAMREAMDHVDDATRTIVEELVRDVLVCITEARAADSPPPAGPTRPGRHARRT